MEKRPTVVPSGATELLRVTRQEVTRSGVKNREDRPVWMRKNAKAFRYSDHPTIIRKSQNDFLGVRQR
jgi:hypothetical protein